MPRHIALLRQVVLVGVAGLAVLQTPAGAQAPSATATALTAEVVAISAADCIAEKIGTTIPVERIGEPVRRRNAGGAGVDRRRRPNAPGLLPRRTASIDPVDMAPRRGRSTSASPCRPVEPPRGAARGRRHERHDPRPDRRRRARIAVAAGARLCHLRQRLRTSAGAVRRGGRRRRRARCRRRPGAAPRPRRRRTTGR